MNKPVRRESESDPDYEARVQAYLAKNRAKNQAWRRKNPELRRAQQKRESAKRPYTPKPRTPRSREDPDVLAERRREKRRQKRALLRPSKPPVDPHLKLVAFRARDRASKKGLTVEQVEELRERQGGACAVCGDVPERHRDGRDGLYIDHRHDNGAVRGMLCPRCNAAAGVLDKDPEWLRRLAVYVQRGADPGTPWVEVVHPRRRHASAQLSLKQSG